MKKASKRRILFAARMATMVGAACFAVSGISETLGQEKEKSRPVYIATEEVAETTYTPEVEEATQPIQQHTDMTWKTTRRAVSGRQISRQWR